MIKFWEEDICYIKRNLVSYHPNWYRYTFRVRRDTENYLINKYKLKYNNIYLSVLYDRDNQNITIYILSKNNDGTKSSAADCEPDDYEELNMILKRIIKQDLINYEEYLCESEYFKRDSRWENHV